MRLVGIEFMSLVEIGVIMDKCHGLLNVVMRVRPAVLLQTQSRKMCR